MAAALTASARTALGFMTRIPVRDSAPLTPEALSRAAVWFPAVGLLVGAVMGGVHALAGLVLPPAAATLLALLAAVLVTGGFHEDGLADCADAGGAHVSRARRHEILHDSRVGTYGALALVFAVAFPLATLSGLGDARFLRAALVGHALGRWSTVALAAALRPSAAAKSGALLRVGPAAAVVLTVVVAAAVLALGGVTGGAAALATAALLAAAGAAAALRVFGGVSGDVYGAVNKLCELGAYAALVAVWT